MKVTQKEYEAILREFYERCKDMVLQSTFNDFADIYSKLDLESLLKTPSQNSITISWAINFCVGDLKQILGRLRRTFK